MRAGAGVKLCQNYHIVMIMIMIPDQYKMTVMDVTSVLVQILLEMYFYQSEL